MFKFIFAERKPFITSLIQILIIISVIIIITIIGQVETLADTIYVPDDYATIQEAVDAASSGDTIIVRDGTYDESITFPPGKKIILRSVNGASSTTIRGDNGSATVTFDGSLEGTILEGFTITHASGNYGRGITALHNNYLIIKNCNISNNKTGYTGYATGGGGMHISFTTLEIIGSTISNNETVFNGGGIRIGCGSTLDITNSTISNNRSDIDSRGGGIYIDYGTLDITDSTISNNEAHCYVGSEYYNKSGYGGGIYMYLGYYVNADPIITIGGSSDAEKNTICGNYKTGEDPSLDQQIRDGSGSLYETYKDTNYISAYCGENNPPTIEITSGPSGTIDYDDVTFTWSGNDPDGEVAGYYYELDDPTPENWTTETNHTFNSVSEGNHTFYVQAKDNDGATSSVVSRSFTYIPPVSTSGISVEDIIISQQTISQYVSNTIIIQAELKNLGEVTINSYQVELYINGNQEQVKEYSNLAPAQTKLFYVPWTLNVSGDEVEIEIKVTKVDPPETNTDNNNITKTLSIYYVPFNIKEDIYSFENLEFTDWLELKSTLDETESLMMVGIIYPLLGKLFKSKGYCYGMASTVIAYKEGSLTIPNGGSVNDLEFSMPEIRKNILNYQSNLLALGTQAYRTKDQIMSNFPCVSDEYQKIVNSLKEGKLMMLTLGESGTFKAHQLVAYQYIKDKDTNIAYVYFYDPDDPGYEWVGELYPETFFFSSFAGDNYDMLWAEDLKPLPQELIEEYFNDLANLIYDGLKTSGQELIGVFSSINPFKNKNGVIEDTLITDEYGRKIGYLDGTQINEIPDGVIEIFGNFQTYQIPLSLNYDIQIKGKEQGVFELHLTKPNPDDTVLNLVYQDVSTENNSEASLTIGPSVTDFSMQLDQDGDGIVDEIKDPDFIEGVALLIGDFGSADNGPPDCKVDFEDLMIFALAYGSTSSDPNWNLVCDIAGPDGSLTPDGVIDFEDLMIFSMHYGETCAD